ncbi:hypothetical protein [Geodermatophilus siccatus]|nr:hypothetical protein [Geodermatophilus siccatus]
MPEPGPEEAVDLTRTGEVRVAHGGATGGGSGRTCSSAQRTR